MMRVFPVTGIEKLGFDTILERIEGYLKTDQGRTTILSQTPSSDFDQVRRRLNLTEEIQSAIEFDDPVPHGSVVNIKPFLDRIGPAGSFLDGADLLEIRALAVTVFRLRKNF